MRVVVSFEVKNEVSTDTPFTIKGAENRSYYCKRESGKLKEVSVVFSGVDVKEAPKFGGANEASELPRISVLDQYSLLAERDIRAWQSIVAPFRLVEIDFTNRKATYHAESVDEEKAINLSAFSIGMGQHKGPASEDFSIFGRAFLAIPEHYDDIQKMAFYIEGMQHLDAGRCIDAYNFFYLYLEANYSLKSRAKAATEALLKIDEFLSALKEAASTRFLPRQSLTNLSLDGINDQGEVDAEALTKNIVKLRGHLRHNSLSNPNRWDPHKQEDHRMDAVFLARVCQNLAMPLFNKNFRKKYADEFLRLAQESKHMTTIRVTLTIKDMGATLPNDVKVDMNFPTVDKNPNLAKSVMERALHFANNEIPGAEIFAIRAITHPQGVELFRYDIGPQIGRS